MGAPGPNGFLAQFYRKHWRILGTKVCHFVLDDLNQKCDLNSINETYITLIPKTKNASKVGEFRPISFCNVVYKIISKVLANRLKIILPDIISPNQSAFIPSRLITDNVLIAFESFHTLSTRNLGKKKYMALKVDKSKTYNRVE